MLEAWQGVIILACGVGIGWVIWGTKGDKQ